MLIKKPEFNFVCKTTINKLCHAEKGKTIESLQNLNIPTNIIKKYWGGGVRLNKKTSNLEAGLIKAALIDNQILVNIYNLCAGFNSRSFYGLIIAGCVWPWNSLTKEVHTARWHWLLKRFQPTIENIVWVDKIKTQKIPDQLEIDCQIKEVNEEQILLPSLLDKNDVQTVLEDFQKDIAGSLIETLGHFIFDCCEKNIEASNRLSENQIIHAAELLNKTEDIEDQLASGCLYLISGNYEATEKIATKHIEQKTLKKGYFLLRVFLLLAQDKKDELMQLMQDETINDFPLIKGLICLTQEKYLEAAESFTEIQLGKFSYCAYLMQLAAGALLKAGVNLPDNFHILEKGWLTEDERQLLQGLVDDIIEQKKQVSVDTAKEHYQTGGEKSAEQKKGLELTTYNIDESPNVIGFDEIANLLAGWNSPKELLDFINQTEECHILYAALNGALENRELATAKNIFDKLQELELNQLKNYEELRLKLSKLVPSYVLPGLPKDFTKVKENSFLLLNTIIQEVRHQLESAAKNLTTVIEALKKELLSVGLLVPEELENAKSLQDIERIRSEHKNKIQIERIFLSCLDLGIEGNIGLDLTERERLNIYVRLFENGKFNKDPVFLERILADSAALLCARETSSKLILDIMETLLLENQPLPCGIWQIVKKLDSNFVYKLHSRDITSLLDSVQEVDIDGLADLFGDNIEKLPFNTRFRIKKNALLKLEPNKRISEIATLLIENFQDTELLDLLFKTLYETRRFNEAFYLLSLGIKIGSMKVADNTIHEILVLVLLDLVERKEKISFINDLFYDYKWLMHNIDDIVILLYLLYKSDLEDMGINLLYQAENQIYQASNNYPKLVKYLISKIQNKNNSHEEKQKELKIIEGKIALEHFRHDLLKQSCFVNWQPATKYQEYFRKKLEEILVLISKEHKFDCPQPEELIDKARTDFKLHEPEGTAKRNMYQYLEEQLERLGKIQAAILEISLDELPQWSPNKKDNLKREMEVKAKTMPIKHIYEKVMENC